MNNLKTINNLFLKSGPPLIIPEIGINHFGSLAIAKKIVDKAALAGAKIIKTQTHMPDHEMSYEARFIKPGNSKKTIYNVIKESSLSLVEEQSLKNYIEKKGLVYLSTPFCVPAANFLNEIGIKIFKIGSGEFSNFPLVETIAKFKKPMILSSGMHSLSTIKKVINLLKKLKAKFIINYCVNLYPAPIKKINFKELENIKSMHPKKIVGYSDHTDGLGAAIMSCFHNVNLIEKHFCLNKNFNGPDIPCSMDQKDLKLLVDVSDQIYKLKKVTKSNLQSQNITKNFAFHSLVTSRNLIKGHKISLSDISIKRPGTGYFTCNDVKKILGKKVQKRLLKNRQFGKLDVK